MPPGYHPEAAGETMVDRTRRVAEGLSDLLDGLEYHYPGEVNEDNFEEVLAVLGDHGMDLPVIAAGLHTDPTYALGAFINPDPERTRTYEERYEVYRSLYPATREAMHRLAALSACSTEGAG